MKKLALLISFLSCLNLSAQNTNLNDPLPENNNIIKGVLSNGMTYYLYSTDFTKDVASYYIIQNVGSILENDDQQGLAHFLEHMAFNGTQNFEGKSILNTMETQGLVFGKDINAYTSFDETVYNIDNIPTTAEMINTGLMILKDWSNYLLLTDEEIDAERGVIKEEWRTRQNGGSRILQQSLPTMFNNSLYSKRLPIGLMDVVDNFEYEALRDFYHDWYRTDLQAIAIVGDIDVKDIEQKIKILFSEIPAVENPKDRFVVQIDNNQEMLYNLAMDKEISTAKISFGINHPRSLENQTVNDLYEALLNSMVTSMITSRLNEIRHKPETPFLGAGVGYGTFTRAKNQFSVSVVPKPEMQQEAFKAVLTEVERAVKFGFTQAELDRSIVQFSNSYENQIKSEDDLPHGAIIDVIKRNYLENETMTDVSKEYDVAKHIFSNLTTADLHKTIKDLYTTENRILSVTGVEGKRNLTKEEGLRIIKAVESDQTMEAYIDDFAGKTLMSGVDIQKGSIISETVNIETGATNFELSNGANVYYKFADKNKDNVQFFATSYGGESLIVDADLASAAMVTNFADMSGLGDYSAAELPKVMAGKTAGTMLTLGPLNETIVGFSVTKDVDALLQQVYLRFEKPRFDQDAFKLLQNNLNNQLTRRSNDLGSKIQDSITTTLYGYNHPKHAILSEAMIEQIDYHKMVNIYKSRFSNASDFNFFIVGDIKKEDLKPLLETYIASISSTGERENFKNNSDSWVKKAIDKDIMLKMEVPKASVRIAYKNNFDYSLKNEMLAETLVAMLQLRYNETLREQEGGTYGASARASLSKRPVEKATLQIGFDCDPDKVEQLLTIVHAEVKKMANGEINQLDLDKTLTNYLKDRKQMKDYNNYDLSLVSNYVLEGYNMDDPKNFEDIVNSMTAKDIQGFTKELLVDAETFEIVFKPEM